MPVDNWSLPDLDLTMFIEGVGEIVDNIPTVSSTCVDELLRDILPPRNVTASLDEYYPPIERVSRLALEELRNLKSSNRNFLVKLNTHVNQVHKNDLDFRKTYTLAMAMVSKAFSQQIGPDYNLALAHLYPIDLDRVTRVLRACKTKTGGDDLIDEALNGREIPCTQEDLIRYLEAIQEKAIRSEQQAVFRKGAGTFYWVIASISSSLRHPEFGLSKDDFMDRIDEFAKTSPGVSSGSSLEVHIRSKQPAPLQP